MEELKDKRAEDMPEGAEADAPAAGRFRLSRRALIIALAGVLALAMVIAGIFAYRASARQKEAIQLQQKKDLAREEAAKAAAAEQARESRRAHAEVMAASPLKADMPAPPPPEAGAAGAVSGAAADGEQARAVAPPAAPAKPAAAVEALKPAPAATVAEGKAATPKKGAEAKPAPEVNVPSAAGGCTLSGGRAEDYGKALGRCLEEFNRLEGRKN